MPSHALRLRFTLHVAVRTPRIFLLSVWPLPRSLATTYGISVDVSSSPYLDVSVQAVPSVYLFDSVYGTWTWLHVGFPIRKSPDRSLFAAPRSLSQLVTSFVGSWCQGIHLMLFFAWTSFVLSCLSSHIIYLQWKSIFTLFISWIRLSFDMRPNCSFPRFSKRPWFLISISISKSC